MIDGFHFRTYTQAELRDAGEAFIADLNAARAVLSRPPFTTSTTHWTDLVLNWFAAVAPASGVIDCSAPRSSFDGIQLSQRFVRARPGTGEAQRCDLMHSDWVDYGAHPYWTKEHWKAVASGTEPLGCRLALECEWTGRTPAERYVEIMHEAGKLSMLEADTKVLVFGTARADERQELMADLRGVRARLERSRRPWLVIDVPFGDWSPQFAPTYQVLADGEGQAGTTIAKDTSGGGANT